MIANPVYISEFEDGIYPKDIRAREQTQKAQGHPFQASYYMFLEFRNDLLSRTQQLPFKVIFGQNTL